MYYVEKEIHHEGKTYLQIRIHTACCKRQYLVEVLPNGNYYDLELCGTVPWGAKDSITLAWDWFKKNGPPTLW